MVDARGNHAAFCSPCTILSRFRPFGGGDPSGNASAVRNCIAERGAFLGCADRGVGAGDGVFGLGDVPAPAPSVFFPLRPPLASFSALMRLGFHTARRRGVGGAAMTPEAIAFVPANVGNADVGFDILGHTIEGPGNRIGGPANV